MATGLALRRGRCIGDSTLAVVAPKGFTAFLHDNNSSIVNANAASPVPHPNTSSYPHYNAELAGEEVTAAQAFVHEGLIDGKAERFRQQAEVMVETDGGRARP